MKIYTTDAKVKAWYKVAEALYPTYRHMTLRQRLDAIKVINKAVGYSIGI